MLANLFCDSVDVYLYTSIVISKMRSMFLKFLRYNLQGYSSNMLAELNATSRASAERQLYVLMKRMIDRMDVDKPDILARCKSIMDGIHKVFLLVEEQIFHLLYILLLQI